MKNLIYKEINLTIPPSVYFLLFMPMLLLIPEYPYFVSMFYCLISIQVLFNVSKANKDAEFTAMLPIPRRDIVKAKHFSVAYIQLLQILVAIPFAIITCFVNGGNIVGLDANFAFFGFTLIEFSVFNIIFLPWFYRSGYKLAMPMSIAFLGYASILVLVEVLVQIIPALNVFDGLDSANFVYQIPLLIAGIVIYFATIFISYKLSVKNFEKVSL